MRDALILMIVAASLPLILARPWIGILVWSWLGYMNPHRLTWGFAYNLPFAMVVGLTTLIAVVFYKGPKKVPVIPLIVIWGLFVLWMNLSTLMALDRPMSMIEWDRTMKIQLFALLTVMLIRNKRQVTALVWVIAMSLAFFGVKGGIFAVQTGGNSLVFGPPGSFIEDNNALGLALVMTVPLLLYLIKSTNDKRIKLALLASIGLTALAILSTHSRGAFLAVGTMGFLFWMFGSHKLVIGVMIAMLAVVLWNFMPVEFHERIFSISDYSEDGSAMGRINAWWFAFNLAKEFPLTGAGFGTFTPELFIRFAPIPDDFHDSHSIYFEVMAEHGFVGVGLFFALGATAIITNLRNISMARNRKELQWVVELSRMLIVVLCSYAVGGAFLGLAYFDLYYSVIALTVIMRGIITAPPETEDYSTISEQLKNLEIKHGTGNSKGRSAIARNL